MNRSLWKGPFIDVSLLKKDLSKIQKTWSRSSTIPSSLIGKTVLVYTGKEFKRILINREKVGFKFGEFSFTRKYTKKLKEINKKKKK